MLVAAAMVALKVIATVVGEVSTADTGVTPPRLVAYCGTPLRLTG